VGYFLPPLRGYARLKAELRTASQNILKIV
jgi:hypothetical protein